MKRRTKNYTRKDPSALIDVNFDALGEQAVTVPEAEASESMAPRQTARIKALRAERREIEAQVGELVDSLTFLQVLTLRRGLDGKTASQILLDAGGFDVLMTAE